MSWHKSCFLDSFLYWRRIRCFLSSHAHVFLCVVKDGKSRTHSVVSSEERTSHTAPPSLVGASSQSESHVCRMMAEDDESLELFPPSRKTRSLPYGNFPSKVD